MSQGKKSQDMRPHYQQQFQEKENKLHTLFQSLYTQAELPGSSLPPLESFASPEQHYRMRAEFRVWHDGDDLDYVMFNQETKQPYKITQFDTAHQLINTLMPVVLDAVKVNPLLRERLFQIDYLVSQTNQALISLLYHRQLDEPWQRAALELREQLRGIADVHLIGRARKQQIVLDQNFVVETLTIQDRPYHFEHVENSFTQPNAKVNEKMIEWALHCTKKNQDEELTGDLLELYCGNGNFSLPLAQNFRAVLGTEISRTSVESAQRNIEKNNLENVRIVRMPAEDVAASINQTLESRRVERLQLEDYDFSTVLVDPPRAGLDELTLEIIQAFDHIVYISCNPQTLMRDLSQLLQTHRLEKRAFFDQFPYTEHMEAGVYLSKKSVV